MSKRPVVSFNATPHSATWSERAMDLLAAMALSGETWIGICSLLYGILLFSPLWGGAVQTVLRCFSHH